MTKSVKRLYENFRPDDYDLHLIPDSKNMYFKGKVIINGQKTGRPSKRLTFHQNGLKITNASIIRNHHKGNVQIEIIRINQHDKFHEVRLHTESLMPPGSYNVSIEFEAPITRGMTGLYPCFFKQDGHEKIILATQFESHHAREVFPCIDEPEAKATFDLTLTTESGLTVLGNTPVKVADKNEDGTITTSFEKTPRMSSYLLAFVIGNLHARSGKTKKGTDVSVWGSAIQPVDSFDFALDTAIRSIEFFEEYFNVAYPLAKADHVALPDFASGAMENWGLITYREAVLLLYPDAASQSSKETIATVITHETSHQWFGNLVTMRWWDDLWLNESFANMMEYVAVDSLFPEWKIWETFVTAEGLSALRRDSTPGVQAVKTQVNHPDEIGTLFDPSIVYAKGGRLLYMLKNYIGETAFRKGLQNYFKTHAYGNTEGSDLWKALSETSGKDVAGFMNPWLERSGFPVISVNQDGNNITFNQQHFLENPDKSDERRIWPVPLFINAKEAPDIINSTVLSSTLSSSSWIFANEGARGHYIVRYENIEHREALSKFVSQNKIQTIDRLMLLSSSAMLAKAGMESFADTLNLMGAYEDENSDPVWDVMALTISDARRFIDTDTTLEAPIKSYISRLVTKERERLGWTEKQSDSAADKKLRATILGLSAYSEEPEVTQHALSLFDKFKLDNSSISAELRGIVLVVAVKQNYSDSINYLIDLYSSTHSSDLQRDIAGSLTATKSITVASRLLDLIKDDKIIKPQDADRWLFYLLRNRHVRLDAWQWMVENWSWIEKTYHNDKSYDHFPRYAAAVCNTRELQKKYQEFFEPKMEQPVLKRNIAIGLEEIENRLTWLERDLSGVQEFFKSQ